MFEEAVLGSTLQAKATRRSGHLLDEPDAIIPNQVPLRAGNRRRAAQPRKIQAARLNLYMGRRSLVQHLVLEQTVRSRAGGTVEAQ
jgi:hypothetical protein